MNRKILPAALVQFFLAGYVICTGLDAMRIVGMAGLCVISAASLAAFLAPNASNKLQRFNLAAAWLGAALVVFGVYQRQGPLPFRDYYALMGGMLALSALLAVERIAEPIWKTRWRALGACWILLASAFWLGRAYLDDLTGEFYCALLSAVTGLVLCRVWFRFGPLGKQVVNTFILLFIAVPAVDLALQCYSRTQMGRAPQWCYSYEDARAHPIAYAHWTHYYSQQWGRMGRDVFEATTSDDAPSFRLKPGSTGYLFNSKIVINSNGFRGAEIPAVKGDTYRIVALGESTTFGVTMRPEDETWPVLLERMIKDRLKPRRPVEVINAGTPAYSLHTNLRRLSSQILPLKPDMIISYHGINGFDMIAPEMLVSVKPPPGRAERPLQMLGDFEFSLALIAYKRQIAVQPVVIQPANIDPMTTPYAGEYEKLITAARTNGIKLMLANYSMAVNRQSPRPVILFYAKSYSEVVGDIAANEIHSAIVQRLAAKYPDICFVDTHSNLDGVHDKFIDLVHLTQAGNEQLAENIFAGIRDTLEKELASGKR